MEHTEETNPIEELAAYLDETSLSDEDKSFWTGMLAYATSDMAFSMLCYLQEFPDKTQWATDMLKRKVEALETKDASAWGAILAEEEDALRAMAGNETEP